MIQVLVQKVKETEHSNFLFLHLKFIVRFKGTLSIGPQVVMIKKNEFLKQVKPQKLSNHRINLRVPSSVIMCVSFIWRFVEYHVLCKGKDKATVVLQ